MVCPAPVPGPTYGGVILELYKHGLELSERGRANNYQEMVVGNGCCDHSAYPDRVALVLTRCSFCHAGCVVATQVIEKEEEQGAWGFKALKQMMKLLFAMKQYKEFSECYTRLLGERRESRSALMAA